MQYVYFITAREIGGMPCMMSSDYKTDQASQDEARLIARARTGDSEAFAALVESYKRLIYWHISHSASTVPDSDVEDLFQEGLVGLFKAVRTYDGVSSAFATYASSCISHSVISAVRRYRKQNGDFVPLDETDLVSGHSPESEILDRESSSLLYERVFSILSRYERSVFELYLTDHSYAEIARSVGKSEKSIANAVCRIRKKLRDLLS